MVHGKFGVAKDVSVTIEETMNTVNKHHLIFLPIEEPESGVKSPDHKIRCRTAVKQKHE